MRILPFRSWIQKNISLEHQQTFRKQALIKTNSRSIDESGL